MGDDVLFLKIQVMHQVRPGPVKIDRSGVALFQGPDSIHGSDGLSRFLFEIVKVSPTERMFTPWWGLRLAEYQRPGLRQTGSRRLPVQGFQDVWEVLGPVFRILQRKRAFCRGTGKMRPDHVRIVRIQDRGFKGPFEEIVRVLHEILIQSIRLCHQDDHGFSSGSAHPAASLPGVDHGARVTHEKAYVEIADVNPHLQGTRGHHTEEIPLASLFSISLLSSGMNPAR